MENGVYNKRKFDWSTMEITRFTPHLWHNREFYGCGATALSLITGVPPEEIKNTNWKQKNHWKDTFMVKFLKQCGCKVRELTKCNINSDTGQFFSDKISNRHVILMSQLVGKKTATWAVVHNKIYYHNFQTHSFDTMSLLNSPTLTCYVVVPPPFVVWPKGLTLAKYAKVN